MPWHGVTCITLLVGKLGCDDTPSFQDTVGMRMSQTFNICGKTKICRFKKNRSSFKGQTCFKESVIRFE